MQPWIKIAGSLAALFAGAAAVALIDRALTKPQAKIDADRQAAAQAAEEPAGGTPQPAEDVPKKTDTPAQAPTAAAPQCATCAPAQPAADEATCKGCDAPAAEAPVQNTQGAAQAKMPASPLAPGPESAPNPNPVLADAQAAPRTPDGRLDAEKLCAPEDFCDWEELGCQG